MGLQHYTGPSHVIRHVAVYVNCSYGNFWIGHINLHVCDPICQTPHLDAYMKYFVYQKYIQTRDEILTSFTDVAALTRKSHKRVAVNVLLPKEIAPSKPMIRSHTGWRTKFRTIDCARNTFLLLQKHLTSGTELILIDWKIVPNEEHVQCESKGCQEM